MELSISDNAAIEFNKSVEGMNPKPYLRVGARPGGCSGWTLLLIQMIMQILQIMFL